MKRALLAALILMMTASIAWAERGTLTNQWASWVSLTVGSQQTFTFADKSRDIWLRNGDASATVYIDLQGGTIVSTKNGVQSYVSASATNPSIIQLDPDSDVTLSDYQTNSISMITGHATASPVTVIATF
jgi:hypothetical protein